MFGGKKREILANGKQARATVVNLRDTGTTINNAPRIDLTLLVSPEGEAPFEVSKKATVSRLSIPEIGSHFWVRYDPSDPTRVEFDEAKAEEINAAARAGLAAQEASAVAPDLAQNGILGRASVVDVTKTPDGPLTACAVTMGVRLVDGTPPYRATTNVWLAPETAANLNGGQTICTVRADPSNHERVAISLQEPTPIVTVTDPAVVDVPGRALREGTPCSVVVLARGKQYLCMPDGDELWATKVRVVEDSSEFQVFLPVPDNALAAFQQEGRQLPAKRIAGRPGVLAVDWVAAGVASA